MFRSAKETAIICGSVVVAFLVVVIGLLARPIGPDGVTSATANSVLALAGLGVAALGMVLGARYLTTRKKAQLELTGGDQYRRLSEEYRRLADLAITAQEHTDLKLGEVNVQLDHVRGQIDSLRKILSEVE